MINQTFSHSKEPPSSREDQMKESNNILRKVDGIKESMANNVSNAKMLSVEMLNKYLPEDHLKSFNSRDGRLEDNRKSLQKRLERLFRDEKQMLQERHYQQLSRDREVDKADSYAKRQSNSRMDQILIDQQSLYGHLNKSESIDRMQKKIRLLEEKYLHNKIVSKDQASKDQTREKANLQIADNEEERSQQRLPRNNRTQKKYARKQKKSRQKAISSWSKQKAQELKASLTEQIRTRQALSDKKLQAQLKNFRRQVQDVKFQNSFILKKLKHRQERKATKKRSKQLLLQILAKLEFINNQINSSKHNKAENGQQSKEYRQKKRQFQRQKIQLQRQIAEIGIKQAALPNNNGL